MSKVLAMDPDVKQWWIPKVEKDEPENEQFRIEYKNLRAKEEARITDNQIESITKGKTSKYKYAVSSADLKRCYLSITGWENFKYPEKHPKKAGENVPFSEENIEMIPPNIRSEFVTFLTKRDEIATDDDDGEGEDLGDAKTE